MIHIINLPPYRSYRWNFIVIFVLILVMPSTIFAKKLLVTIDDKLSVNLLNIALYKWGDITSSIGDIYDNKSFIYIHVINNYGNNIGFFSVNIYTGQIWDTWACRKISNPRLRAAQEKVRRGLPTEELKNYPKFLKLEPECLN